MARCKYAMREHQVSNDNGFTWTSLEVIKGDLIEYGSADCPDSGSEVTKWVDLEGDYICEDNRKYKKQVMYISYDDGVTWYIYFPTMYRKGEYIGVDDSYCNNKFEGHYVENCTTTSGATTTRRDPLKIVKCDTSGSSVLTRADISYYVGCATTSRRRTVGTITFTSTTTCCYTLTAATIGNCVTEIGRGAFSGHTTLSAITIPNSVGSIGNSVFSGCTSLTSVTIGSGVTSIGNSAFEYCSSLTSINIPSSVTSIGEYAFQNCSGLTKVIMNSTTPPLLGNYSFRYSDNCLIYVPCDSINAYKNASGWSEYSDRIRKYEECPFLGIKLTAKYNNAEDYIAECNSSNVLSSGDTLATTDSIWHMTSAVIGTCVTSIGDNAFCVSRIPDALTSVTIPTTVTSIGKESFYFCQSLPNITIPDSVTSIGESAFRFCSGLTSVEIPSGVTSIGQYAFGYCKKLTSVTSNAVIPPELGVNAFENTNNCPIYVPCNSVDSYKSASGWSSYNNRILPIQSCQFNIKVSIYYATNGRNIIIKVPCDSSETLSVSDFEAFYSTQKITAVNVGDCVTTINDSTFSNYSGLTSVEIPSGVTTIGEKAFSGCSSLSSCTIGGGNIGASAFTNCVNLSNCVLGNSVTSIGNSAFEYCSGLTSIVVPDSVTSIGNYAFRECGMSACTIGSGVTSIGYGTFYRCLSLNMIELPNTITSIGESAFTKCALSSINIPNSVKNIGRYAFSGCSSATSCTIGNSVTSIGNYAFKDCFRLSSSISIPNSVKSIGESAFTNCHSATSCTIGNSVTSIGNYAFKDCYGFINCTIGSGIIGACAFQNCSGLTSIEISSSVTSIGYAAFSGCSSLGEVIVKSPIPPTISTAVFTNTNNCPIYVPCGTLSAYTSDSSWGVYNSRLQEMSPCEEQYAWNVVSGYMCSGVSKVTKEQLQVTYDNGTTWQNVIPKQIKATLPVIEESSIDCARLYVKYDDGTDDMLLGCDSGKTIYSYDATNRTAITSITIGDCVETIGNSAFTGCSNNALTSIDIPSSVTSIGNYAFKDCSSLTSISIPNSVTSIGYSAFTNCYSVTNCTIGNSVNAINNYTFTNCSGLTSISIPDSVTSIGEYAFSGCSNLSSCIIGSGVTTIKGYAFWECSSLTSVTIPASVTSIYWKPFAFCSLTSITILATTPPTLESVLGESGTDYPIYVPAESVEAYKTANIWRAYGSRIQPIPTS